MMMSYTDMFFDLKLSIIDRVGMRNNNNKNNNNKKIKTKITKKITQAYGKWMIRWNGKTIITDISLIHF